MQTWVVTPEEEGRRLREILRGSMRISYSAMKSAKWNGQILLNGEPAPVDTRVRAGDQICVIPPERPPAYVPEAYDLPLKIPYEDDFLMIIDKPAGLASQSSRNHPSDSLENAVYHYLDRPEGFIYRPVNRLDKGTGGLMVAAKDGHTQDLLQRQLHTTDFIREYLALTDGIPEPREAIIDLPIGKEDAASVRRVVRPDGHPARTRYRVLATTDSTEATVPHSSQIGKQVLTSSDDVLTSPSHFYSSTMISEAPFSPVSPEKEKPGLPVLQLDSLSEAAHTSPGQALIHLRLETGRTHQIRVHLAALGCPVRGDFLYGTELPEEFPRCFALHSTYLQLRHPHTGEMLQFESIPAWTDRLRW